MNKQQGENNNLTNGIKDLESQASEEIKGGQTREHVLLAKLASPASNTGTSGDWNNDGAVDAADYIVWRRNY
jgi:hypothetical protein